MGEERGGLVCESSLPQLPVCGDALDEGLLCAVSKRAEGKMGQLEECPGNHEQNTHTVLL